jgi:hypothetical protein
VVVVAYNNTTRLGNAYGLCVVFCTVITSTMMAVAGIVVFKLHPLIVFPIWLAFALFDGLYLSAALFKVPAGAYFTLITSGLIAAIMVRSRVAKGFALTVSPALLAMGQRSSMAASPARSNGPGRCSGWSGLERLGSGERVRRRFFGLDQGRRRFLRRVPARGTAYVTLECALLG